MKLTLLLLLIGHILGDYYLQTQAMADKKEQENKTLLRHCLVYALPFIGLAGLYQFNGDFIRAAFWAVLIHCIIDSGKAALMKRRDRKLKTRPVSGSGKVYLLDQMIHWLSLIFIAFFLREKLKQLTPWPVIEAMFTEFSYTLGGALRWLLAILLIYRPSNITFIKLFSIYKPEEIPGESAEQEPISFKERQKLKAGGIIGVLEKMISLIFLSVAQYMAIGLILTAKSIARYDKISKSSTFAEYYLIGTLTSIIMVLLIYFLCFVVLV